MAGETDRSPGRGAALPDRNIVDRHLSIVRGEQGCEDSGEGCLAGAIGPGQEDNIARLEAQGCPDQDRPLVEPFPQRLGSEAHRVRVSGSRSAADRRGSTPAGASDCRGSMRGYPSKIPRAPLRGRAPRSGRDIHLRTRRRCEDPARCLLKRDWVGLRRVCFVHPEQPQPVPPQPAQHPRNPLHHARRGGPSIRRKLMHQ